MLCVHLAALKKGAAAGQGGRKMYVYGHVPKKSIFVFTFVEISIEIGCDFLKWIFKMLVEELFSRNTPLLRFVR